MKVPWRLFFGILWGSALLGLLFTLVWISGSIETPAALSEISAGQVIFLAFGVVFAIFLRGVRWWLISGDQRLGGLAQYILVFGWSFVLMSFTPARAGELSRVLWAKEQGRSAGVMAGKITAERLQDFFILFAACSFVLQMTPKVPASLSGAVNFSLACVCTGYLVLSITGRRLRKLVIKIPPTRPWLMKLQGFLARYLEGLEFIEDVGIHAGALLITLLIWGGLAVSFYAFLSPLLPGLTPAATILLLTMVNLSSLLGLAPGNLGLYEMAGVMALQLWGIEPGQALWAVITLHLIVIAITVIYGVICLLIGRLLPLRTSNEIHLQGR